MNHDGLDEIVETILREAWSPAARAAAAAARKVRKKGGSLDEQIAKARSVFSSKTHGPQYGTKQAYAWAKGFTDLKGQIKRADKLRPITNKKYRTSNYERRQRTRMAKSARAKGINLKTLLKGYRKGTIRSPYDH